MRGRLWRFVLSLDNRFVFVDLIHQRSICRNNRRSDSRYITGRGFELLKREVRANQLRIAFDTHGHAIAPFDLGDMLAFLVHQEVGNIDRALNQHLARAAARAFFFDGAQYLQRQGIVRTDQTGAVASRTGLCRRFDHARAQTLPRHFHQAKTADASNLNTRPICFQLILHALFDSRVVLALVHVDKVDNDQTGQIAQAQLPGNFFRRL